jgi:hypothetical protein
MLVISSKPGQLGNMLFTYANVIAAAHEYGWSVANPAFDDYAEHFVATSNDLLCRFPARESKGIKNRRLRRALFEASSLSARVVGKTGGRVRFVRAVTLRDWDQLFDLTDPEFRNSVRARQLTLLRGWKFRASELLEKHAEVVREHFRPLEKYERNVNEVIARAREGVDVLVGVHIRQGIIDFANARHYYHEPPKYADFMDQMEKLLPGKRVGFLLCSDRKLDTSLYSGFKISLGTNDLIEDLYSFSKCDYLIGPPSTYTMWASFYGNVPLDLISDSTRPLQFEDFAIRY